MRRWLLAAIVAMISPFANGDEINRSEDCLTEAIRKSVRVSQVVTNRIEAVMVEGMQITFTNSNGGMTITCGKGFERSYTWAGDTRSLVMWPRKRRWYGSLGLYNPGAYIEGELEQWKEHDGVKRGMAEEGQRHFTNTSAAVEWIQKHRKHSDYVYNDSGLVVGMAKEPPSLEERKTGGFPGTLTVEVWQIYIDGKKPQKLAGSNNKAIAVYYPQTYDMETVTPPAQPVDHDLQSPPQ